MNNNKLIQRFNSPVLALALHIDDCCNFDSDRGVHSFFDDNANIIPALPGQNIFAYSIADAINVYKPENHSDFINLAKFNIINGAYNESVTQKILNALDTFSMPEQPEFISIFDGDIAFEDLIAEIDESEEQDKILVYDRASKTYHCVGLMRAGFNNTAVKNGCLLLVMN